MRYPVDNFLTDWNTTAGYEYGDKTDYGFHEADDLNLNGGGNNDLGQPIYAVTDGEITSVHSHTGSPTFGNHIHLRFNIDGKDYWAHYAHCQDVYVVEGQKVKQGDKIATCGNSGTTFAHVHFAIKNQPTGIDSIAKTQEDMKKWESPIKFIKSHLSETPMATITQKDLDQIRQDRDTHYNTTQEQKKVIEQMTSDLHSTEEKLGKCLMITNELNDEDKKTTEQLLEAQKTNTALQNRISELEKMKIPPVPTPKIIYRNMPTGFFEKLKVLFS